MDAAGIAVRDEMRWRCVTTLCKFHGDIEKYRRVFGKALGERLFFQNRQPFEGIVQEGNLLLQEGVQAIWTLVTGGSETAFNNANARIGVGDSSAAEADTQTGLQGTSTAFKAMDTGYPVVGALADKKVTFRATFGDAEGNFAWEEWTVDNGASANKNLNRKVQALGTKSGGSWQLTVDISLA